MFWEKKNWQEHNQHARLLYHICSCYACYAWNLYLGTNLEEAPDSIYNEACSIVALMTFQQITCSGAYKYMRANLTYCSDLGLLCSAYDHYVHYVLSEKFRKETREGGWNVRDVERKVVQRERQRMNDVDAMMGRRSNQRVRQRPKKPIISDFEKTPKSIPIDFYRPEWFNQKNHSKKQIVADLSEVAFVPIRDLPPGPNEQLGNRSFKQKYCHSEDAQRERNNQKQRVR
ncbi:hypothetical protein O181_092950 [Austropuccinia psidii MF-1]|uniref:Uncharacterized protein n=1 Tax=Austropuccinia psidii MF-1 TaxID=1389203 RepID=A0A9Q3P9M6_9BASI|nr:hypothetical protein [Austropuccinia psidii MF-1]